MIPSDPFLFSLLFVLAAYVAKRITVVWSALRDIPPNVPRELALFAPISLLGVIAPKLDLPYYFTLSFAWQKRGKLYGDKPIKAFATVPIIWGDPVLHLGDINAAREVFAHKAYEKDASSGTLQILGNNVVTAEGDVWKRHRRIVGPAFNHSTYENVWKATAQVYKDMVFHEGWCDLNTGMSTQVIDINAITHKVALYLICNIAFGLHMHWTDPYRKADGSRNGKGQLTIPSLILITSASAIERYHIPRWLTRLPLPCSMWRRLNEIDEAWEAFEKLMYERVREREGEIKEVRALQAINTEDEERYVADTIKDLFGRLVNSGLADGKNALTDREIIGNCYIFAFAGHETTANTIAATLAFLALNPEKQDWVYCHIKDVLGDREPVFEDYDALDAVLACFHEALRIRPPAYLLYRRTRSDHVLHLSRRTSSTKPSSLTDEQLRENVPTKEGMMVSVDLAGLCYDQQIFHDDPFAYKPERWLKCNTSTESDLAFSGEGNTPVDSEAAADVSSNATRNLLEDFVAFSLGPRACLGAKFARVEAVSFITHVLRDWRVEIAFPSDSDDGPRTMKEWTDKYMEPRFGLTAALQQVPLRFIRRK